jgi:hypothetical protein
MTWRGKRADPGDSVISAQILRSRIDDMPHHPTQHGTLRPLTVKPRVAGEVLGTLRPLTVKPRVAREMLGFGQTLYDELVRAGRIKTVVIGRIKMPTYESLEALIETA